jgi:hypothetical protein
MKTQANPVLLRSQWFEAKTSEGKTYGFSKYSLIGEYLYRRRSLQTVEYSRVAVLKVYSLHHWYEIENSLWEPVDVYGFPTRSVV